MSEAQGHAAPSEWSDNNEFAGANHYMDHEEKWQGYGLMEVKLEQFDVGNKPFKKITEERN